MVDTIFHLPNGDFTRFDPLARARSEALSVMENDDKREVKYTNKTPNQRAPTTELQLEV